MLFCVTTLLIDSFMTTRYRGEYHLLFKSLFFLLVREISLSGIYLSLTIIGAEIEQQKVADRRDGENTFLCESRAGLPVDV